VPPRTRQRFRRIGSTSDAAKGYTHSRRQGIKILVDSPQQRVRSEKDGGKQRHIDRPTAQILQLLSFDQFKRFLGRSNDGLLQPLEVAERALTRGRGRPAGEFQNDKRMARTSQFAWGLVPVTYPLRLCS
jgi:hypothetical protein